MMLTITQRPTDGALGGPYSKYLRIHHENVDYSISITQCVERCITVEASKNGSLEQTLGMFYSLESLLMLFDGQFYPITKALDGNVDVTHSFQKRTLASRHSADFMRYSGNMMLNFEDALNEGVFLSWLDLRTELDLIHKMVLYCVSDVAMPADMKCAFMVEAFNGVYDLVHAKIPSICIPHIEKGESRLQKCLLTIMQNYGIAIFLNELQHNANKFTQILVDSRNRIGHIKSKQDRVYLSGPECVIYLLKLSLLYRVALFELIGINSSQYNDRLVSWVQAVNNRQETSQFINSLIS